METRENCLGSRPGNPIEAGFEIGEVLLTARIADVLRQVFIRIVARDVPASGKLGKAYRDILHRRFRFTLEGFRQL